MKINKIYNSNCLETMKSMDNNYIDSVVTDPPYGYSFMGKDWDKVVPSVDIWKECLRIMKPGAFAFIMSAPRQDVLSHMIVNLDKAGFDTGFTSIYWTYASGFPKAMNIGKAVDKKLNVERKRGEKKPYTNMNIKGKSGLMINDTNKRIQQYETFPESDEAKLLDGSYGGFQPKPAVEVIIVAMKPLSKKTFTDQALSNGKGITWFDDCRIPANKEVDDMRREVVRVKRESETWEKGSGFKNENNAFTGVPEDGRFPANLIVSDDVLNDGKIYSSGFAEVGDGGNGDSDFMPNSKVYSCFNDSGSFSRYFDIDKWWEERIKSLPENVREVFPFLIVPKAAKSEKNFGVRGEGKYMDEAREVGSAGGSGPHNRGAESKRVNHHPTVKPIKLMSYLVTLGSREGDIILDPFAGSGTTLIAAAMQSRNFIGIEISKEYIEIAEQRLRPFTSQAKLF